MRSEELHISQRPSIGFVVEGSVEWHSYRSLVARITGNKYLDIPIVDAKGNGGILGRLEEHLDNLVNFYHPYAIIVTIDLREIIRRHAFESCADLCRSLNERISTWVNTRREVESFSPLPTDIEVIVQIQSFETWLISDLEGLKITSVFSIEDNLCWQNVDAEISNPCKWIREHQSMTCNIKNPRTAKALLGSLDIGKMANASKSFSKFRKEVTRKYQGWENLLSAC